MNKIDENGDVKYSLWVPKELYPSLEKNREISTSIYYPETGGLQTVWIKEILYAYGQNKQLLDKILSEKWLPVLNNYSSDLPSGFWFNKSEVFIRYGPEIIINKGFKDGIEVESDTWSNNSQIIYSLDGLRTGTYSFEILIEDMYDNSISDTVQVVVTDSISQTTIETTFLDLLPILFGILLINQRRKK